MRVTPELQRHGSPGLELHSMPCKAQHFVLKNPKWKLYTIKYYSIFLCHNEYLDCWHFLRRYSGSMQSLYPTIKRVLAVFLLHIKLQCMPALVIQVTPDLWTKVPVDSNQTFFLAYTILSRYSQHFHPVHPCYTWIVNKELGSEARPGKCYNLVMRYGFL